MTSELPPRDAVLRAMSFEAVDPCPYYVWVDPAMVEGLAGIYGPERFLAVPGGPTIFDGSCSAMTEVTAQPAWDDGAYFQDEFGARFRRGSILHLEAPALTEPSLAGYTFPGLTSSAHFDHLEAWARIHASRFRVVQLGMLFWERTWFMRGMEEIMVDLSTNPGFVEDLLDGLEEVCTGVIDRLLSDHADRVDAIGFSEDYGTETSLLLSPESWRRFIKPRLARMCARIRRGG